MSFEGYYQLLCENKHYQEEDCYSYRQNVFTCGDLVDGQPCEASIAWSNLVDDTNCDGYGKIEVIRLTEPETKRCDLECDHIWTAATFAALTKGALGLLAEQAE